MKKFDTSTPSDVLRKSKHRCLGWGILFSLFFCSGIGQGLFGAALVFLFVAILLFLRYRKSSALLRAKDQAAMAALKEKEERTRRAEERHAQELAEWNRFLAENDLVRQINTKVVGVTFRNSDGSSRQEALAEMSEYVFSEQPVILRPYSYQGSPAFAVYCLGDQIGNLSASLAEELDALDDSYTITGCVTEITGGDGLKYGCNLRLDIYREKQ